MGVFRQIFPPSPYKNKHIKNGPLRLKGKNKNRQRGGRDLHFLLRNFHFNFFFKFWDSRRRSYIYFFQKSITSPTPKGVGEVVLLRTPSPQNAWSSNKITKQPPPAFRCMKNDGEREDFSYTTQDKHRQNELLLHNIFPTFNHFNCVKGFRQVHCLHTLALPYPLTHLCMY